MNRIVILLVSTVFTFSSCYEYLDLVPDDVISLEDYFTTKENAMSGLTKMYTYMPVLDHRDDTPFTLGDDIIHNEQFWNNTSQLRGERIMRGFQSEQSPYLGEWSGTGGGKSLYIAIRQCNIFLENIHNVADMTPAEIEEWEGQAMFLKGYYHFCLLQKYGPIIIREHTLALNASKEELFVTRSKIDDCFDAIIRMMRTAIPKLKPVTAALEAGMIDQVGAKAILARVMVFRASPFYNGNDEWYSKFLDHDGQPFFPMTYSREKWKDAIDACTEAIEFAVANQKGLYEYVGQPYRYDVENFEKAPDQMQLLYNLRMRIVDPWNKELLWGSSNVNTSAQALSAQAQIQNHPAIYAQGLVGSYDGNCEWARPHTAAPYSMLERFYTKNGLPPNEDLSVEQYSKLASVTTPEEDDPMYEQYIGIMQPNAATIQLYLDREMRFYADLGLTGGYWRSHQWILPTSFVMDGYRRIPNPSYGGMESSTTYVWNGPSLGRGNPQREFNPTCVGVQKIVHPESTQGSSMRMKRFPYPIIRFADLLLMKAEALNEYHEGPDPAGEVYELINQVRRRAGVYDVQYSYGTELGLASEINKHTHLSGLRDIILHERSIEFAFEGIRFWDMIRHKRAPTEFSKPIFGWNPSATEESELFQLQFKQTRRFTLTDCLWPISTDELNRQSNLIQNPGWR